MTVVECDREPLAPVTFAKKLPVVEPIQERVDVPEPPLMVFEERLQDRFEFDTIERVTVPVNPLSGAIIIEDVPGEPVAVETFVGLEDMVKSGAADTWYVTDTE